MDSISKEIFNILKGANYQVRMFDESGDQTLDEENASRLYAYDQDLMITIRQEEGKLEIVAQAGTDFDILAHRDLVDSIKYVAHKNLGEFTVRKFSKQIQPKDFVHEIKDKVAEAKMSRPYGSVKTSYIKLPESRIIIKHSARVNEEKRGARSRNIHDIFVENKHGEKYMFPYKNIQGAKAMAMHVNEGGNPYDQLGQHILAVCEETAELREFLTQVRTNKLMNESNSEITSIVRERVSSNKSTLQRLSTARGHNNFTPSTRTELEEEGVDNSARFTYNKFQPNMGSIMERVERLVKEAKRNPTAEIMGMLQEVGRLSQGNVRFSSPVDLDDPVFTLQNNPARAHSDAFDYLANALDMTDKKSNNDELSNVFAMLSNDIGRMDPREYSPLAVPVSQFLEKIVSKINGTQIESVKTPSVLDEAISHLIRKIN